MAFTSIGYDGSVNERQWAELVPSVGSSTYGVSEADDLKVTAVPGQPLTVSVASGSGWGHGVLDTEAANTTVACETLSSGTRWDLIALRRNWQPLAGGPTSVVAISGTSTKELPGGRKVVPGVEDDQPLALVLWSSTQTQPVEIIDLRCWAGNGGLVAVDPLVKLYLNKVGTCISLPGSEWKLTVGDNDLATWVELGAVATYTPVAATGWSATGDISVMPAGMKRQVTVDVTVKRTGAAFTLGADGWEFIIPLIPTAVQSSASGVKYLPILITGGGNHILASAAFNPAGSLSIRSTSGSYGFTTNALFTINQTYYI